MALGILWLCKGSQSLVPLHMIGKWGKWARQLLIANYFFSVIAATNNISNTGDEGNPTGQKVAGMGRPAQTQGHHHKIK